MQIIVTTPEELEALVTNAVRNAFNSQSEIKKPLSDRCGLEDALEITGLSKSKLYKLTSAKQIPHKTFGSRLIFSREELQTWVETQTIDSSQSDAIELKLAKSARNK